MPMVACVLGNAIAGGEDTHHYEQDTSCLFQPSLPIDGLGMAAVVQDRPEAPKASTTVPVLERPPTLSAKVAAASLVSLYLLTPIWWAEHDA